VVVLPYLQPPVLTDEVRHSFRRRRGALTELRISAAADVGTEPPPLVQLERVRPRRVALALFTFVGAYALLGQLGNFSQLADELRHASWAWILAAALLSAATNVGYAVAYVGATTARLPFGRTVELQVAGSFTNLIAPNGLGTAAINARFLQVRGVGVAAALASLFMNTAGSALAQALLFVAVLPVAGPRIHVSLIPWRGVLAGAIAVGMIAAVAGAVLWHVPRLHRFVAGPAHSALDHLHGVLHSPAKLSLIIGGQCLVQLLYATTLGAAALAFGTVLPLSTLLLVTIASSTLSGLIPAPGGLGVAEATLAGALTAAGIPPATAISIALTDRLVTTWLPVVPGWIGLRALERDGDL
jgi:glycosyltransferase 2 family protein